MIRDEKWSSARVWGRGEQSVGVHMCVCVCVCVLCVCVVCVCCVCVVCVLCVCVRATDRPPRYVKCEYPGRWLELY